MAEAMFDEAESGAAAEAARGGRYRRFSVDLWATSLNDVEIGFYRQSRHRAKSSQFTRDMDVIGQVKTDGKRTGIVAYRKGLWDGVKGPQRRLVIKLFSETMNWRGTMDMMIGRSLQLTHGSGGVPVTAYSVNVANQDQLVQVERSANKWALFPERFSFFIMTDKGPHYYRLRRAWVSIGTDYVLYDQRDRRIGYLDGKLVDLGGLWKVKVDQRHAHPLLDATLQMFCAMLRFNGRARRHIGTLADDMRRGKPIELDQHERDLYLNPRRAR